MSGHLALANGTRVPIRDGFVLGRVAGCDLVIDDAKASRKHAKLIVDAGVVEIEDLQSSNGTLLNDKPVQKRVLRDGDRIQIGKTVIVFHEGDVPGGAGASKVSPESRGAPASPAVPASPAAPSGGAFDENDLFGGDATSVGMTPPPPPPPPARPVPPPPSAASAPAPAPVRPVPPPAPPPSSVVRPVPAQQPPPSPPPPPSRPAPPPGPPSVVEFADEVVEVRKPSPAPPAAAKPAAAAPEQVATAGSRVLQYSKRAGGSGGVLGDDLGQLTGGQRGLLIVGVLVVGAAIVYAVMRLVG